MNKEWVKAKEEENKIALEGEPINFVGKQTGF